MTPTSSLARCWMQSGMLLAQAERPLLLQLQRRQRHIIINTSYSLCPCQSWRRVTAGAQRLPPRRSVRLRWYQGAHKRQQQEEEEEGAEEEGGRSGSGGGGGGEQGQRWVMSGQSQCHRRCMSTFTHTHIHR